MKTTPGLWTYKDYLKLEDDKRYEIINGELCLMPGANRKHQRTSLRLAIAFSKHVEETGAGEVYIPPFDVVLSEENVVQPDVVVVLKDNLSMVKENGIFGVPDMVVEVVSPSSLKKDTEDKRRLYASYGVKEFWLVFPEERVIEVLSLEGSEYRVCSWAYEEGQVCSKLIQSFCVELGRFLVIEIMLFTVYFYTFDN